MIEEIVTPKVERPASIKTAQVLVEIAQLEDTSRNKEQMYARLGKVLTECHGTQKPVVIQQPSELQKFLKTVAGRLLFRFLQVMIGLSLR